ncbi:hypothetical protein BD769DRAFT_1541306, partial [Suillus cothurnatus]
SCHLPELESCPHVVLWARSGFCQKLETFLRFSGISYDLPRAKFPFADIKHNNNTVTVPDSLILSSAYLIENGLIKDPDAVAGLTPAQKGEFESMAGVHRRKCYTLPIVRDRWYMDENYAVTADEIFEVQSLQKEAFEALEARMSGHLYFHDSEQPTSIDLIVYGFLA